MMETLLSFIATAVGELLDWLVGAFLSALNLTLDDMVLTFPFLVDGYKLFRSIGIGLIFCIAVWNLIKFFGGQLSETKDTPIQLLLRAFISGGLLWYGGYVLELVVDIAKIPFDTFLDTRAITIDFQGILENFSDFAWFGDAAVTLTVGAGTILLIATLLMLLIGWNVLKLMVEVCERYLMIAVLVYASPLIYPTITSSSTAQIFKKWCGMFFGQCALMTLSAWMLKLICSGFSFTTSEHNIMFRLMLTLAMCKIAQRIDTYMQQLGIGVATTGGNLLDEAIGVGMAMARSSRNAHGSAENRSSKTAILGAGADGSLSRMGGLFGGLSNMMQKGVRDYKSGESAATITQNAKRNFMQGTGVGSAFQGWKDMNAAERSKASRQAAAGILSGGVINNAVQSMREARSAAQAERASGQPNERRPDRPGSDRNATPGYQPSSGSGRADVPNTAHWSDSVREAARNSGLGTARYTQTQRQANGVGAVVKEGDRYVLNETAQKAGLSWDNNGLEARNDRIQSGLTDDGTPRTFSAAESDIWNQKYPAEPVKAGDEITAEQARMWNDTIAEAPNAIEGSSDVAGDFMAANYAAAGLPEQADVNEAMVRTAEQAPLAAEQALMNHHNSLQGNDALGDALLKSAIGEEAFAGELPRDAHGNIRHGRFSNIEALAREDGRRLIKADYQSPDGKRSHFEIYNNNALTGPEKLLDTRAQFQESMRGNMQTVRTKGSGEQIILRKMPVTSSTAVPPQQEPPPSQSPPSSGPFPAPPRKSNGATERRQAPEAPPADNPVPGRASAQPVPFPAEAGEERSAAEAEGPVLGASSLEGKNSEGAGVFNQHGDNPGGAVSGMSKDAEQAPESSPSGQYRPRNDVTQEDFNFPADEAHHAADSYDDSESDIVDNFPYEGPTSFDYEPETEPLPAKGSGNAQAADTARAESSPLQTGSPSLQAENAPEEKDVASTISGIAPADFPQTAPNNTEATIEPPHPLNVESVGDADDHSEESASEPVGDQGKRHEPTHGGGYQSKNGVVQEEFSIPEANAPNKSGLYTDSKSNTTDGFPYEGTPVPDIPPAMGQPMDRPFAGKPEERTSGESTRLSRPGASKFQTENAPEVMSVDAAAADIASVDTVRSDVTSSGMPQKAPQQRPSSADSLKNTDISTAGHKGLPFTGAPLWQPYTENEAAAIPEVNWTPVSSSGNANHAETLGDAVTNRAAAGSASPGRAISDADTVKASPPGSGDDHIKQAGTQTPSSAATAITDQKTPSVAPGTLPDFPQQQSVQMESVSLHPSPATPPETREPEMMPPASPPAASSSASFITTDSQEGQLPREGKAVIPENTDKAETGTRPIHPETHSDDGQINRTPTGSASQTDTYPSSYLPVEPKHDAVGSSRAEGREAPVEASINAPLAYDRGFNMPSDGNHSIQSESPMPEPPSGSAKAPLVTNTIEDGDAASSVPAPDNSRSDQWRANTAEPPEERNPLLSSSRNPLAESPRDVQEDGIIDVKTDRFSGSKPEWNAVRGTTPTSSPIPGYEQQSSENNIHPSELPAATASEPPISRDSAAKDTLTQPAPLSTGFSQAPDYKPDDRGQAPTMSVNTQPSTSRSGETRMGTQASETSMGQEAANRNVEQTPKSMRGETSSAPPPKHTQSSPSAETTQQEVRTVQTTEVTKKIVVEERRQEASPDPAIVSAEMFTVNAPSSNQKMRVRGRAVTQDRFQLPVIRNGNSSGKNPTNPKEQKGKSPKGQK